MPRAKTEGRSDKCAALRAESAEAGLREHNDCAVVAVAAVTGRPYAEVHALMKANGRRDRRSTPIVVTEATLKQLGFRMTELPPRAFINAYPAPHNELKTVTSHHPERFAKVWPKGRFLMRSRSHILAIVDGQNCDWSKGRSLRARKMYQVTQA
jgi:hypothetical protein